MENDATVFTMYLNNVPGFPSLYNDASGSVSWNVNWDNFFEGEHLKWNKCRVRIQYITDASSTVTSTAAGGVLVSNSGSRYNNPQTMGVPLGIVQVATSTTAGEFYINVDTLQTLGQNITIPSGSGIFNLSLFKKGFGSGNANASAEINTLALQFQAMLQFELYDPK